MVGRTYFLNLGVKICLSALIDAVIQHDVDEIRQIIETGDIDVNGYGARPFQLRLLLLLAAIVSNPTSSLSSLLPGKSGFFFPCGHHDFESAVTAQNDEFKSSFDSSHSRLLNVKS